MPDSKLAVLLQQLKSDDPKARAKACRALGKRGNPEAIPYLARVYQRFEEDDKVRAAAEKALKQFIKKMPSKPGASKGRISASAGRRWVIGLVVSFVVLLLLNVVLRMGSDGEIVSTEAEAIPTATATPSTPTPRDVLLATYETLYQNMLTNFVAMKTEWGTGTPGDLPCTAVVQPMQVTELAEIDRITYPDFGFVLDLNLTLTKMNLTVDSWNLQCSKPEGQQGSLDDFNTNNDRLNALEPEIQAFGPVLAEVKNNPAPTVGPTATLTPIPSDTVPAPTETPIPTQAPATSTGVPTLTPTITRTPEPTIDPGVLNAVIKELDLGLAASERINVNYWFRIRDGQPLDFGCSFGVTMPTLYDPAPVQVQIEQKPELGTAIQLLNDGIVLLEQSVNSFLTSCQNGNYAGAITPGIDNASQAYINFEQAKKLLVNP
jgi:hypothetical protein